MPTSSKIPERLKRRGRPAEQQFEPDEALYKRCRKVDVDEGHLAAESIRFPDFSVNRAKYSDPEDVLLPDYEGWGVAEFQVKDVPARVPMEELTQPPAVEYTFSVVHDPLDDNYSHTEVRALKDGVYRKKLKITHQGVKQWFRVRISQASRVIRDPDV